MKKKMITKEKFDDVYDGELARIKYGNQFLSTRNWNFSKENQLSILFSCGFKVPKSGRIKTFARNLSLKDELKYVLVDIGRGSKLHKWVKMPLQDALCTYPDNFGVEFIEFDPSIRKRRVFLARNILEFEVGVRKFSIGMESHQICSSNYLDSDAVEFGQIQGIDENECSGSKKAIQVVGRLNPLFCVDFISDGSKDMYAVGLEISPKLRGTPLDGEDFIDPSTIAELIANETKQIVEPRNNEGAR